MFESRKVIVFICSLLLAASVLPRSFSLRYGFESDLFAYEEWVLTVAFLLYFIGGGLASHEDVQIKADIVQEYIRSRRSKVLYQGSALLLEAVVAAGVTYFAFFMFLHEFARWPNIPTTPVYKIPLAVPRFFILAGLALMTLHAFLNGLRYLRAGLDMPSGTDPPGTAGDAPVNAGRGEP